MYNLATLLENSADKYPEREAIVLGDTRLTYAQVNGVANMVANLLVSRGIRPGDKVALSCPNLPYFTVVYYGILKAGATVVPLNVLLKAREVAYHLEDADAKAYFCFEGTAELPIGQEGYAGFEQAEGCETFFMITADPAAASPIEGTETMGAAIAPHPPTFETVATDEDDTAVILYTSGTTGQPKGAELRHRNMRDNALAGADLFGASAETPDTYLCVLPLFHSFGQTVIQNGAFAFGGTVVMLPRFDASGRARRHGEGGRDVLRRRADDVLGPARRPRRLGRRRAAGGEPAGGRGRRLRPAGRGAQGLRAAVRRDDPRGLRALRDLPGGQLLAVRPARAARLDRRPDARRRDEAAPDRRLGGGGRAPDEIGEIAIKGHNVMKGYYNRPEATDEVIRDGWFRSGDLARRDEDGWYYIVDRSKDMIIRGGYNVYPREIEEVLLTHPDVSLAAVVGVPHESHGEEIKAYVILNPGATVTPDELVEWGKQEMASYKYPRLVSIVDSLPMTATGKILKRELV